MVKELHKLSNRYLFTVWTIIITIGLVLALVSIKANFNEDYEREQAANKAQTLAFCHALSDYNQAIRDILTLSGTPTVSTPDMTPSQQESIRIANERRKGYQLIADNLFALPKCEDGYVAKSRQEDLNKLLVETVPSGTTTTTTNPGG
jgi:hypothetical protein